MTFSFSKYSGLGNDFVFIDNRSLFFPEERKFIQDICHRRLGIGADGIVLLQDSDQADYKMRIFNADGSEAEMCGNALRCLYLFLEELQIYKESYLIETFNKKLLISKEKDQICCEMGEVYGLELQKTLHLLSQSYTGHFVNTGVPHFVLFVDSLEDVEVEILGRALSHHDDFGAARSNINFISIFGDDVHIRTYERGVEKETLACGTGAAASALISHLICNIPSPIKVRTRTGEFLKFIFDSYKGKVHNLKMIGDASCIFTGQMNLNAALK